MATTSGTLDYWRNYFRSADSDIFEVIEYAIAIAALDCPKEFRMRRDRIAEKLFSCRLTRCFGCDRVELAVAHEEDEDDENPFVGGSKESKVNSSTNDHMEMVNRTSNYSYDEAEALTEEIEAESQILGEVYRIKEILCNHQEESASVLFESLRKLQLMALTVETLEATEIGLAVNLVRKHGVDPIRQLARTLIDEWKLMVDEWVSATTAAKNAGGTPESVNPSVVDEEEGLPSPPLDEMAFLAAQTTSMELSQFFDGMDDDGNPRNNRELDKNHGNGRKPSSENINRLRKQKPSQETNVLIEDKIPVKKQEATNWQKKPRSTDVGPGRPKITSEHKATGDTKLQPRERDTKLQQRRDPVGLQRKPPTSLQDKSKCSDELLVQAKIEASKRKLYEGYQQAENAKKQRTIQVMEVHDLPKQSLTNRNHPHPKPGTQNRHWSHGRR